MGLGHWPRHRANRWLLLAGGTLVVVGMIGGVVVLTVPISALDAELGGRVRDAVAAELSCPGGGSTPRVELTDGRVVPQLVDDRLTGVRITLTGVSTGGARNATLVTTLRGVTGLRAHTQRAESLETTVSVAYADLPPPTSGPTATLSRADDGRLRMSLQIPEKQADRTTSVLLMKLGLDGNAIASVPQGLQLFGKVVPAAQVSAVTGGVRREKLPVLPAGLHYTSVGVQRDGVHVGLEGVVVAPLSTLPRTSGGRSVSYRTRSGLLGIRTVEKVVPGLLEVPLTIWTRPTLQPGRIALVPQSVQVLGEDRPTDDPIASVVLGQTDRSSLGRALPALPPGVRYTFASVDAGGIRVGVKGVTVRPMSQLKSPVPGLRPRFGAKAGLLTLTIKGSTGPALMSLLATPKIVGNDSLDLAPETVRIFGTDFDPERVFSETGSVSTSFPMAKLAEGLTYTKVEVLAGGLRFTVTGRDVTLGRDLLGDARCPKALAVAPAGGAPALLGSGQTGGRSGRSRITHASMLPDW